MTYDWGTPQAAAFLGCHVNTLKKWAAAGEIPATRTPGGFWRFSGAELEAYVESRRVKS